MEVTAVKIQTKAVHAGDRKRKPGEAVPITTPIYTASSFFYDSLDQLDRVFARDEQGYCYARYDNPTNHALEELMASLEGGHGALACASGMAAVQVAILGALTDRPKSIVAADALYGATIALLMNVLAPLGIKITFVDICDLATVEKAIAEHKPGCVLMETVSNPLLRVGQMDRIASAGKGRRRGPGGGQHVRHAVAGPPAGVGRELGGTQRHQVPGRPRRRAGRNRGFGRCTLRHACAPSPALIGPVLGPFESYLTMRGIKTFPLRMERQCANACRVASWLGAHPQHRAGPLPRDPSHPDAATIQRPVPARPLRRDGQLRGEGRRPRPDLRNHGTLQASGARHLTRRRPHHGALPRDELPPRRPPKQRERLGIRDNLLRLSVGIEAVEDIIGDLEQALS